MAVADKYVDELCGGEWTGAVCPHGTDHGSKHLVCQACLEYAMQGE